MNFTGNQNLISKETSNDRPVRSYRNEREFGLLVGGVFAALGGWWFYRGKSGVLSVVLVGLGGLLMLLGWLMPVALVFPNRAWMGLAAVLSFITTRIILAIIFFGLVTPIGIIKRLSGWDPLRRRANSSNSYWRLYSDRQRDSRHYEKMF
jgi:Saxitoxin biosynthesis operon protein SxtJ